MNNPEASSGLEKLLEMLNKIAEGSIEREDLTSKELLPTPPTVQGCRMINPEVSSRLQRLLGILNSKAVDGSIEWKKPTSDELFSTSVARFSFTIAMGHSDDIDSFIFGMYDPRGVLVSLVTTADEQYPDDVKDNIRELWTTVSARASHLIIFLDQALNALEGDAEKNPSAGGA
jgi:hypothetical protein